MKKTIIIAVLTSFQTFGPFSYCGPGGGDDPCNTHGDGGGGEPPSLYVPEEFSSIQAAIDAAPSSGAIIHIAPGDYYEQLYIADKNLILSGEPAVVLHATPSMSQTLQPLSPAIAVIGVVRSYVTIFGLTIEGAHLAGDYAPSILIGVFYLGSNGSVEGCNIKGFRGPTLDDYWYARGISVWNGLSLETLPVNIAVLGNTFEDNMTSVVLAGDDRFNPTLQRTTFTMEGNTVSGFGPSAIAADGVLFYPGAGGTVRGNLIQNHSYTGPGDAFSSGIIAADGYNRDFSPIQPILFEGNTFRNNDEHLVLINASESQVVKNVFEGSGPNGPRWGALALSGRNIRVADNDFSNTTKGIFLFGNDLYFQGWPFVGIAIDAHLTDNWFANVLQPVRTHSVVTGLQEQGRQTAPFEPVFRSVRCEKSMNPCEPVNLLRIQLRRWHDQPLLIEASSDFVNWTSVYHSDNSLPLLEYTETNPNAAFRFYRNRK